MWMSIVCVGGTRCEHIFTHLYSTHYSPARMSEPTPTVTSILGPEPNAPLQLVGSITYDRKENGYNLEWETRSDFESCSAAANARARASVPKVEPPPTQSLLPSPALPPPTQPTPTLPLSTQFPPPASLPLPASHSHTSFTPYPYLYDYYLHPSPAPLSQPTHSHSQLGAPSASPYYPALPFSTYSHHM
jgi:hypothetical protein